EIERRLKETRNPRELTRLIKAGLFLLDRDALKAYKPAEAERLYEVFLSYVVENGAGAKGRSAHAAALALRLLGKLPEPPAAGSARERTLQLLDPRIDPRRATLVLEMLVRWKRLPKEAREAIERDLLSQDPHVARTAVGLLPRVRDAKAKTALLN